MRQALHLHFLILLVFISTALFGQAWQNNKWHFGYNSSVDFNTGTPGSVPGSAVFTSEGSASVADRFTGNLLFYTNGITIWNRLNQPMPNGTGLLGGTPALTSSTTAALIVPRPGNSSQYYVFTVDEFGGPNGLRSNLVDMNLNGGLGDIVAGQKNILISNIGISEKLECAPLPGGLGYWLISREVSGNQYFAWQITATGISTTPVSSFAGTSTINGAGYLKFNRDHTRLANAYVAGAVDVLSFDNVTGQIANIVSLPVPIGSSVYGVEFSPSGRFLYVSNLLNGLFQFDLNAPNVAASMQTVANAYAAALQIGPDCRIYIADGGLSCIPNPDLPAPSCGYILGAVNIQPGGSSYGLPMDVIYPDSFSAQIDVPTGQLCTGNSVQFSLSGLSLFPQAVEWNFGDPASGSNNTATALSQTSVTHTYFQPGQYVVQVIYEYECRRDTSIDTLTITNCTSTPGTCIDFQYTGAPQQWTVPSGVDTLRVKMWGGAGGGGPDAINNSGGGGGYTEATIAVAPGQVLDILVGGGGGSASGNTGGIGAYPNGGAGGIGNRIEGVDTVGGAGGGGGRSEIQIGGVIYAIAGGGGGGAYNRSGGAGGGLVAEFTAANNPFNVNGFGGTQTSGGAASSNTLCGNPVAGTPGSFLQGGHGASDIGGVLNDRTGGGGGGDGYYGGGGGGSHDGGCFGVGSTGGGGSGYLCSTCPGVSGNTLTAGFFGVPANVGDPVLSNFPGTAQGTNNAPGGHGLVYICYDTVPCTSTTAGFTVNACSSYVAPNGALLTVSGLYIITIPNAAGCDSAIVITLLIGNTVTAPPITASACSTYTAPWGSVYTQSGTYSDTLTTAFGCDSIVSVNLTITGAITAPPITASACSTYTAPWGTTYTQSGTYSDTLTSVNGCDSIVSVNLTITGTVTGPPITASACSTYTAPWGTTYTQSGSYRDTLITPAGCDSVVTLNLVIFGNSAPPPITATSCDSYTAPWGSVYTQSGSYDTTLITVNGCDSLVTLNLTITPSPALQSFTTPDTCGSGDGTAAVTAAGGTGPYVYVWSNGSLGNPQSGLSGGIYTVTVTDQNGCSTDAQLIVPDILAPVLAVIPATATIIEGDTIQLAASGAVSYQWTPASGLSCVNCASPQASPSTTTTYTVLGTDQNGCTGVESVTVRVDLDCNEVFVPSIFSPNGSGPEVNEQVCVFGKCIAEMDFAIYNRWGQQVFKSDNVRGCWDGTYKGKEAITGVYTYRLYVKQLDGNEVNKSGNINLLR